MAPSGTLSPMISQLTNLGALMLKHMPGVHGSLPDTLSTLPLTRFELENVSISGTLPHMSSLFALVLWHTQISGSIDTRNMPSLITLDIFDSLLDKLPAVTQSMRSFAVFHSPSIVGGAVSFGDNVSNLQLNHYGVGNSSISGTLPPVYPSNLLILNIEDNQL
jgi:hypothetical protein